MKRINSTPFLRNFVIRKFSFVKDTIAADDIVVFSKSRCGFSHRAKDALKDKGYVFKSVELDLLPEGVQYQEELLTMTGQRTVPNIFVKGKHLGGCDKTLEALNSGKFAKML